MWCRTIVFFIKDPPRSRRQLVVQRTLFLAARKSRRVELLAFDEKFTFDTPAFFMRIKRGSFIRIKKAEVSKRQYSSKAKSSNVRGVGTFYVTCSNLGQLSPYYFKNLYGNFPRNFNPKCMPFLYCIEFFETIFGICVNFSS
jgi:hypothetical protein